MRRAQGVPPLGPVDGSRKIGAVAPAKPDCRE